MAIAYGWPDRHHLICHIFFPSKSASLSLLVPALLGRDPLIAIAGLSNRRGLAIFAEIRGNTAAASVP
jgi:hypothetical protein